MLKSREESFLTFKIDVMSLDYIYMHRPISSSTDYLPIIYIPYSFSLIAHLKEKMFKPFVT